MEDFSAWIGRSKVREDVIDPSRCNVLEAALGGSGRIATGEPMPILAHWLHFWDARSPAETGPDGHPLKGGFLPPVPLPRRMWAGGRLRFHAPLLIGERVKRRTVIAKVQQKSGRSGDLVFVSLVHEIRSVTGLAIEEEQDLVYRGSAPSPAPAPAMEAPTQGQESFVPDPVLLFRYSALTMNSHRIHYDLPYASKEEGYAGLVVQGPLQATALARLAERSVARPLAAFSFRGVSPAYAGSALSLHLDAEEPDLALRVEQQGRVTMTAKAIAA